MLDEAKAFFMSNLFGRKFFTLEDIQSKFIESRAPKTILKPKIAKNWSPIFNEDVSSAR